MNQEIHERMLLLYSKNSQAIDGVIKLLEAHQEYSLLLRNDIRVISKAINAIQNPKSKKKGFQKLKDEQGMFG